MPKLIDGKRINLKCACSDIKPIRESADAYNMAKEQGAVNSTTWCRDCRLLKWYYPNGRKEIK